MIELLIAMIIFMGATSALFMCGAVLAKIIYPDLFREDKK